MHKKFATKINKIQKSFDQKVVLDDVSFSLYFGEKVALVGANGSGKSTLAKIIMGSEKPDSGSIEVFKNMKKSYLPQEFTENTLVSKYVNLDQFDPKQRSLMFQTFEHFGLDEKILDREISSLSGGEKTKIFLTKITIDDAGIIILDEPTNNLDIEGIEYLEKVISQSKSAFLIISHDRSFMDKTVSKIMYLDEDTKSTQIYDGGYSDFMEKRKLERERQESLYVENQRQKNKIKNEIVVQTEKASRIMKASVMRNDSNKMAANQRIEELESNVGRKLKRAKLKLENHEDLENIKIKRPLKIDFSEMKNSGHDVLKVKKLLLPYGYREPINFEVVTGDRVLISGKNGAGKSTLIKEILKGKDGYNEKIVFGTNVVTGYLEQSLEYGNDEESFLEYFLRKTEKNQSDARKILARFGFADEEVKSKITELSPGMRGRGKIAIMLANNPNLLILDEPTNNLDLEVLEKLEEALENYKGTIIFVSHDRYFIDKIKPNKVVEL